MRVAYTKTVIFCVDLPMRAMGVG